MLRCQPSRFAAIRSIKDGEAATAEATIGQPVLIPDIHLGIIRPVMKTIVPRDPADET
jgi:hypothetical protein